MTSAAPEAPTAAGITGHDVEEITQANASGRTPVVFVHGLWLLSSSWDRWRGVSKVDTNNPDRGPMLIISGEKDHTVPWAIANASASSKKQRRNSAVTEIVKMPGRGHALTIDNGWREVADTALAFVRRFA
jgi:pimeloyl-ACP methyl ester carboxylesterase